MHQTKVQTRCTTLAPTTPDAWICERRDTDRPESARAPLHTQVTHSSDMFTNNLQILYKKIKYNDAGRQLKIVARQLYNYLTTRAHHNLTSAGTTRDSVSLFTAPRQRCFLSEVEERREKWWRGAWLERAFLAFLFLFHGRGLRDLLS